MRSAAAALFLAVVACACAATAPPAGKGAASAALTSTPVATPTGAKGGSPPPTPGVPPPSVTCAGPPGAAMALIGNGLWDVTDPVHPRLVCAILNTVAHVFSADTIEYIRSTGNEGTEVVRRSITSGDERVVAGWPLRLMADATDGHGYGVWTPDGNHAATFATATDAAGNQIVGVWLFAEPNSTELYEFPQPLTDCICRYGIPPPTLAFSADGQYLVAGWPVGKGAMPMRVYRVADATLVQTLDLSDGEALWGHAGHTLYLSSAQAKTTRSWTPEDGYAPLAGAADWTYRAGVSPDGTKVAYTSYVDVTTQAKLGVYVYDLATHATRLLVDQDRSDVTFVKDGWVWYGEEAPCNDCPGQSAPTGRVFAMALATGVEQSVVFADRGPHYLAPGQFYPNS